MENIGDIPTTRLNDEEPEFITRLSPEPNEPSGDKKTAKYLGNKRWKYKGKTYKEEFIGRI